ncbi:FAD-dependent oxidoreductase [Streptomyces sp. HUAS TT3]|uniref:FAD-dependent oxidoreductase n=1 Tax=Streptomyces sp. HUAS TT3 TaxID=3447510 RepID=UPI003F65727C
MPSPAAARGPGTGVDTDAVVVGAGPVGLSAALLLARAGLGVVVLERRPGPVTQSRATDLHARTFRRWPRAGWPMRWTRWADEDAAGVTVRSDALEPLRARRVVAADGASSTLRAWPVRRSPAGPSRHLAPRRSAGRGPLDGSGPRAHDRRTARSAGGAADAPRRLGAGGAAPAAGAAQEGADRPAGSPRRRPPGDGRPPSANAAGRVRPAPTGVWPHTTGAAGCC